MSQRCADNTRVALLFSTYTGRICTKITHYTNEFYSLLAALGVLTTLRRVYAQFYKAYKRPMMSRNPIIIRIISPAL
ncbi:hypothetical protein BVC71_11020 [Marivivens niveibacter]|uniref:Uncharacterized protein n=1 Tax=Marivivens niveibacter TaxID=1930667 RepID=A0A251WYT5_9RHOB|nr:hypothetical protein BVC71_11020 [Marivivens niveibacter]